MKVAICGINGLIGKAAAERFHLKNYEIIAISRDDLAKGSDHLKSLFFDVDAIINLAGAPLIKRWTAKWKKEIYNSRINTTRLIVDAVNKMESPPQSFISASAVGIYDINSVHDEFSVLYGNDFLSMICRDWEQEALKIKSQSVKLSIFRFGVVISKQGGFLKRILFQFKMGLGGKIGKGDQFFPWIHIEDVIRAIVGAVELPNAAGIYNLVAPEIVDNRQFTKTLASVLKRPAFFSVPLWFLKLLFGEAVTAITSGQQVIPQRLLADAYEFAYPTLESALKKELN